MVEDKGDTKSIRLLLLIDFISFKAERIDFVNSDGGRAGMRDCVPSTFPKDGTLFRRTHNRLGIIRLAYVIILGTATDFEENLDTTK